MGSWNLEPGLNNVGSYQVSGQPYASGSINCKVDARTLADCTVVFPYVTRWFKVINKDATNPCKVGFSVTGVTGSFNYFTVGKASAADVYSDSGTLELKVSAVTVSGSTNVDIIAGMTGIPAIRVSTGAPPGAGPNWSGSAGVG
jgi:hypothetical protein